MLSVSPPYQPRPCPDTLPYLSIRFATPLLGAKERKFKIVSLSITILRTLPKLALLHGAKTGYK